MAPAGRSVGAEPGDFARPSETSHHFVCNTRPMAFGLKRATFHSETVLKLQKWVKQPKKGLLYNQNGPKRCILLWNWPFSSGQQIGERRKQGPLKKHQKFNTWLPLKNLSFIFLVEFIFKLWWPLTGSAFLIGKTNSIFSDRWSPEKSRIGMLAGNRTRDEP